MAVSAASNVTVPQAAAPANAAPAANAPATPATGTANPTGTASPFQSLLTAVATQTTATAANAAAPAVSSTNNSTTNNPNPPADSTLIGYLALAAQFQFLTPPTNAAIAHANGIATTAAATPPAAATTAANSRAGDLLLNRAGGPALGAITNATGNVANLTTATNNLLTGTAPGTTAAGTAQSAAATQAVAAQTAAANALPTLPITPAALTQTPVGAALAAAARGGSSNIPPIAPIVSNLTPNVQVPADLSTVAPAVHETAATIPVSGLPAASLGDRPTMAGDRFAAIASAGAQLGATSPPSSGIFSNVLHETTAATTSATATVSAAAASLSTASLGAPSFGAASLRATGENVASGVLVVQQTAPQLTGDTVVLSSLANAGSPSELNVSSVGALASAVPPVLTPGSTTDSRSTDNATTPNTNAASTLVNAQPLNLPLTAVPMATNTTGATASTPPAAQVADAVVSQASVLERPGSTEFHMRLDPPELGRVQIRLTSSGDEIHGQVLVANDSVRQMLESQMPELRQRLEAAGVNVQQFNIATDAGSGGSRNQYQDATPEFTPTVAAVDTPAATPRARIGRIETGLLDVTV